MVLRAHQYIRSLCLFGTSFLLISLLLLKQAESLPNKMRLLAKTPNGTRYYCDSSIRTQGRVWVLKKRARKVIASTAKEERKRLIREAQLTKRKNIAKKLRSIAKIVGGGCRKAATPTQTPAHQVTVVPTQAPQPSPTAIPTIQTLVPGVIAYGSWPTATPLPTQTFTPPLGLKFPDASSEQAIARADHVPFQTYAADFHVGIVAYHVNGIRSVDFAVDGGSWTSVGTMLTHPQNGVPEYVVKVPVQNMSDGAHELRWQACPYRGVCRTGSEKFWSNVGKTLAEPVRYVSPTGDDALNGLSALTAMKTIPAAAYSMQLAHGSVNGGTIYLLAGTHQADGFTYPRSNSYTDAEGRWFSISAAPEVARSDVLLDTPAGDNRPGSIRLLRLHNITLVQSPGYHSWISGGRKWWDTIKIDGLDRTASAANGLFGYTAWSGGKYMTNSEVFRVQGMDGMTIVRNTALKEILSDSYSGSRLVVNCSVDDVNPFNSGAHPDVYQIYGSVDNAILYRLTATNANSQGIFMTTGTYNNFALVESSIDINPGYLNGFSIALLNGETSRHFYVKDSYLGGVVGTDSGASFTNSVVENTTFQGPSYARLINNPGWYWRLTSVPEAPSLAAAPVSSNRVELSWNLKPGTSHYRLERNASDGVWQTMYLGDQRNWVDTTTAADKTYTYRLTAVNEFGSSFDDSKIVTTPNTTSYLQTFNGFTDNLDVDGASVPFWISPLNYSATLWRTHSGQSLKLSAANYEARAQYGILSSSADGITSVTCEKLTAHPNFCGLFARSQLALTSSQVRAGDRYEARVNYSAGSVSLHRVLGETTSVDGTATTLITLGGVTLSGSSKFRIALELRGSQIGVEIQRGSDGLYLTPGASWHATPQFAITTTDNSIPLAGYAGVVGRTSSSGTTLTIDDFLVGP